MPKAPASASHSPHQARARVQRRKHPTQPVTNPHNDVATAFAASRVSPRLSPVYLMPTSAYRAQLSPPMAPPAPHAPAPFAIERVPSAQESSLFPSPAGWSGQVEPDKIDGIDLTLLSLFGQEEDADYWVRPVFRMMRRALEREPALQAERACSLAELLRPDEDMQDAFRLEQFRVAQLSALVSQSKRAMPRLLAAAPALGNLNDKPHAVRLATLRLVVASKAPQANVRQVLAFFADNISRINSESSAWFRSPQHFDRGLSLYFDLAIEAKKRKRHDLFPVLSLVSLLARHDALGTDGNRVNDWIDACESSASLERVTYLMGRVALVSRDLLPWTDFLLPIGSTWVSTFVKERSLAALHNEIDILSYLVGQRFHGQVERDILCVTPHYLSALCELDAVWGESLPQFWRQLTAQGAQATFFSCSSQQEAKTFSETISLCRRLSLLSVPLPDMPQRVGSLQQLHDSTRRLLTLPPCERLILLEALRLDRNVNIAYAIQNVEAWLHQHAGRNADGQLLGVQDGLLFVHVVLSACTSQPDKHQARLREFAYWCAKELISSDDTDPSSLPQ